jgi:hypothetical protein
MLSSGDKKTGRVFRGDVQGLPGPRAKSQGHLMTDDNTRLGRSGEPLCKECLQIHLAAVRHGTRKQGWKAS